MNLFGDYFEIVTGMFTITGWIVGWSTGKVIPYFKKRAIRKCLSLEKKECTIILPTYLKKLHNQIEDVAMCPMGDVQATANVIDLIHEAGLTSHQKSVIYEGNYAEPMDRYNVFCIGGSLANRYTYDLFQQFFPDFKIYATREKYESNPNRIPLKQFRISEERVGFCWGEQDNQSFTVEKDERYAVMVKLSKEDFRSKDHGTVHILFGNGIEGTLAISRYLLFHYKDINKLVRSRRHYFVAFKVKRKTGIIDTDSFVDLTDQMFK